MKVWAYSEIAYNCSVTDNNNSKVITITILHNFNDRFFYRIGNNVILMDDTGGLTCFKCFNLVLRSSNVLQIHTSALDKCYTTEERAVADCPSDTTIREKRAREIMLYSKFNKWFLLIRCSFLNDVINYNFFISVPSIVKSPFYERAVIYERTLGK